MTISKKDLQALKKDIKALEKRMEKMIAEAEKTKKRKLPRKLQQKRHP